MILNGRIALSDIQMGPLKTTFALWGRNLTDDKHIQFTGGVGAGAAALGQLPAGPHLRCGSDRQVLISGTEFG